MRKLFPKIKPYKTGKLKISKLHILHYEEVGNPTGKPVLFLHGGPGLGIIPSYRRFFDPKFYRIILLDQRGSGKSIPFGELRENNTWNIVSDLESLRKHLNIDRWMVTGGSWGSMLAVSYAIKHPESIVGMIIRGVCLGRKSETEWLFHNGAPQIYPDEWNNFISLVPKSQRKNPVKTYYKMLKNRNKKTLTRAARAWTRWEAAIMSLNQNKKEIDKFINTDIAISTARIECHFTVNNFFMEPNDYLIKNAEKIKDIPLIIVQGRYDVICPMKNAWELHKALPKSKLIIVQNGSHTPLDPCMTDELIKAGESFKRLSQKNFRL